MGLLLLLAALALASVCMVPCALLRSLCVTLPTFPRVLLMCELLAPLANFLDRVTTVANLRFMSLRNRLVTCE